MYLTLLTVHLLAATIWTGGHLVLALSILPGALKYRSAESILQFEAVYERIGMPALLILLATGFWLAYQRLPDVGEWFGFDNPNAALISAKLLLLALTFAFAIDARLRLIPNLDETRLSALAWHIIPVTVFSVLFVIAGVGFRTGGWSL